MYLVDPRISSDPHDPCSCLFRNCGSEQWIAVLPTSCLRLICTPAEDARFQVFKWMIGATEVVGYWKILPVLRDWAFVVIEPHTESSACFSYVGHLWAFSAHDAIEHIAWVACMVWWVDTEWRRNFHHWFCHQVFADLTSWCAAPLVTFGDCRFR